MDADAEKFISGQIRQASEEHRVRFYPTAFEIDWDEICSTYQVDPWYTITWDTSNWLNPSILELKEIKIEDLPLYINWKSKSPLWDKLLGET
jgi:hypothetical protein